VSERRYERILVSFRRDLRAYDHAALYHVLKDSRAVHCAFVFDTELLESLPRHDRRIEFIWDSVTELRAALRRLGGGLIVLHGCMRNEVSRLAIALQAQAVYTNHDYEPDAVERDLAVEGALVNHGIALRTFKDQVVFEIDEVLTRDSRAFSLFTAYRNAWLQRLTPCHATAYPLEKYAASLARSRPGRIPTLEEMGFASSNLGELRLPTGTSGGRSWFRDFLSRMDRYYQQRDYPVLKGPSYLSVHLRFGTVSIRELVAATFSRDRPGARTWLSELIWREFYFHDPASSSES
jgi:deoxyribodipyrimidine photo-lyase